ncbi:AraC family transcriptional regulator [Thalassospira marina]|uniref:AraC family transcriptional regulator n=1 Tax=Thalassospira marina TaxID=2048283 RepID=A0A2N3KXA3_9PROT|nr:AraC family transcriptional regulator [Thalassospira marina]PKR55120.1 AraC family transcriptional regulator [Thalassospira marina]
MSEDAQKLAKAIAKIAQKDGEYPILQSHMRLYRSSDPSRPMPCMYFFGLGITASGRKDIMIGNTVYPMQPGQVMLPPADLPVITSVTHATPDQPYLGLWIDLDIRLMGELAIEIPAPKPAPGDELSCVNVITLDSGINDAVIRLLELHETPELATHLLPVIQREITIRLLHGPLGACLRHHLAQESPIQRITRILSWLRENFTQDITAANLATRAHMSGSTFRQHFKSVTGISPLQYLKQIRLLEARQLMLNDRVDAGSAAFHVGYESASQFSREYTRMFGAPPIRDIRRLRETVHSASEISTQSEIIPARHTI